MSKAAAKRRKPQTVPRKPRNPVARSPLLGKGGPHQKSTGARRQAANQRLRKALQDEEA
jgi:hypothetical protein